MYVSEFYSLKLVSNPIATSSTSIVSNIYNSFNSSKFLSYNRYLLILCVLFRILTWFETCDIGSKTILYRIFNLYIEFI